MPDQMPLVACGKNDPHEPHTFTVRATPKYGEAYRVTVWCKGWPPCP